jgi:hypothetical protein
MIRNLGTNIFLHVAVLFGKFLNQNRTIFFSNLLLCVLKILSTILRENLLLMKKIYYSLSNVIISNCMISYKCREMFRIEKIGNNIKLFMLHFFCFLFLWSAKPVRSKQLISYIFFHKILNLLCCIFKFKQNYRTNLKRHVRKTEDIGYGNIQIRRGTNWRNWMKD